MATNFTQFTSEATPSGDVVLVGHNIAGTGEIKTTISQILSAMNLATSSDATFNKVTVTTNVDLSDGSTITVGGGSGTVTIDGVLDVEEELAVGSGKPLVLDGNLNSVNYSIIKSGSRVEFRTTDSNPVLSLSNHRVVVGGDNILGFSDSDSAAGNPDIAFSRGAAGHMQLGNGTVNDTSGKLELADIVASANIDFTGLPTSDPASAGRLYVDSSAGHVIKVSQG